jgi:hypothetical protein
VRLVWLAVFQQGVLGGAALYFFFPGFTWALVQEAWQEFLPRAFAAVAVAASLASFYFPKKILRARVKRTGHSIGSFNPFALDESTVVALSYSSLVTAFALAEAGFVAGAALALVHQKAAVATPLFLLAFATLACHYPTLPRLRQRVIKASEDHALARPTTPS